MKLQKQVTSLEISKRFKELGVKQESLFVWYRQQGTREWNIELKSEVEKIPLPFEIISAFTVAELGEMFHRSLPISIRTYPNWYEGSRSWACLWKDIKAEQNWETKYSATEADARGKMVIYLIEKNLIALPNK